MCITRVQGPPQAGFRPRRFFGSVVPRSCHGEGDAGKDKDREQAVLTKMKFILDQLAIGNYEEALKPAPQPDADKD